MRKDCQRFKWIIEIIEVKYYIYWNNKLQMIKWNIAIAGDYIFW